jgi:hypothetical protein
VGQSGDECSSVLAGELAKAQSPAAMRCMFVYTGTPVEHLFATLKETSLTYPTLILSFCIIWASYIGIQAVGHSLFLKITKGGGFQVQGPAIIDLNKWKACRHRLRSPRPASRWGSCWPWQRYPGVQWLPAVLLDVCLCHCVSGKGQRMCTTYGICACSPGPESQMSLPQLISLVRPYHESSCKKV